MIKASSLSSLTWIFWNFTQCYWLTLSLVGHKGMMLSFLYWILIRIRLSFPMDLSLEQWAIANNYPQILASFKAAVINDWVFRHWTYNGEQSYSSHVLLDGAILWVHGCVWVCWHMCVSICVLAHVCICVCEHMCVHLCVCCMQGKAER